MKDVSTKILEKPLKIIICSLRELNSKNNQNWAELLMDYEYQYNQLIQHIRDEKLRERAICIIDKILKRKHMLWNFVKYPEMVDHCERHTRNVFDLLTRLLVFSQKHLLHEQHRIDKVDPLNDAELFCLIFSVWFHDIGGRGLAEEDKKFLSPLHSRMEHPFVGEELFLELARTLGFTEEEMTVIGELIPPHSSKVSIGKLKPRTVNGQEVRMKLLAVLLSLSDVCDTQEKRVGGEDEVETKLKQLMVYLDNFENEKQLFEKVKEQHKKQKSQPTEDIQEFNEKIQELNEVIRYIKKAPDHYYKHLSVENVFFKSDGIILKKKYDVRKFYKKNYNKYCTRSSFDEYFNDALKDVGKELERVKRYFEEYGITIKEVRPYDEKKDDLKKFEEQLTTNLPFILPFKSLAEKLKENAIRKQFPTEEELNEMVYFDEETAEKVINVLDSLRYCLLTGPISSRKTTFVISFAYHLEKEKGYLIYYLDVKEGETYEELFPSIRFYDSENVLFIIDDCHNSPDGAGKFLNGARSNMKRAKFLFVSRDIPEDVFEEEENNYFESLKKVVHIGDLQKVFLGIIGKFCVFKKIQNFEGRIGNINDVINRCEKNFYLLNELLNVWEPEKEFLSEVPIEKIYNSFYSKYMAHGKKEIKEKRKYLLAALSSIYQFGIPIPVEFLDSQGLGVYGSSLEEVFSLLKNKGLLFEPLTEEGRYYTVGSHPFFAEMVLRVLEYKHELRNAENITKSRDDFTFEICRKYLLKIKNLQLLYAIYKNRKTCVGKKLIEDATSIFLIRDFLKRLENFVSVALLLRVLRKFGIKKKARENVLTNEILEQWCKNIVLNNPNSINSLLRELAVFDEIKKTEFLKAINVKDMVRIYKEAIFKSRADIDTFLGLKRYFGKELRNEILSQLTRDEIKKVFYASWKKKTELYNFFRWIDIRTLPPHFNYAWSEFLSEKIPDVQQWISEESTSLVEIGRFVSVTYWHKNLQILFNNFFFGNQQFLNKLGKATLEEIAQFVYEIARIKFKKNPRLGVDLGCALLTLHGKGFMMDAVAYEAMKKAERLILQGKVICINSTQFSVEGYHDVYTVFIENNGVKCTCPGFKSRRKCTHSIAVFKSCWEKLLESKIKDASIFAIEKMLRTTEELEMKALTTKIMNIIEETQFNLVKKLSESNAKDLAYFLWNIPYDPSLNPKYHKIVAENVDLTSKLSDAKIEEFIFILWNLFEGDSIPHVMYERKTLFGLLTKEGKIGEKLTLVGLLDLINPVLLKRIDLINLKTQVFNYQNEVMRWFRGRFIQWRIESAINYKRQLWSLFLFMLGIRGIKKIDNENYLSYLVEAFQPINPQYVRRIIWHLQKTFEVLKERGKITEKREKLFKETIQWLSEKV